MKGNDLLLSAARALLARTLLVDGAKAEADPARIAAVTVNLYIVLLQLWILGMNAICMRCSC